MWIRYGLGQAAGLVFTLARLIPLTIQNRLGTLSLPQQANYDVVISMTTHGRRLQRVHYSLESLMRGNMVAPIILWLDREDYESEWPATLRRLVDRGVEVRCSAGHYGPHTKYWGTFQEVVGGETRVVTADDDIIYPEWFLERLIVASQINPGCVVAHRAHEMRVDEAGLVPYRKWGPVAQTAPSHRHFATGVSGVLYPPSFIEHVVAQGEEFAHVSPKADDVWLHLCALRSGHRVRQVANTSRNFAVIPTTQTSALSRSNVFFGGNDAQISQAYTPADIEALRRA